jgi:lipopolysaccharide/colanic/teichoic acid biosynthesis glycosyltransferase
VSERLNRTLRPTDYGYMPADRYSGARTGDVLVVPATDGGAEDAMAMPLRSGAVIRYRRMGRWMAVTDMVALVVATMLPGVHRRTWPIPSLGLVLLYPMLQAAIFASFRLYSPPGLPASEESRRLLLAMTIGVGMFVFIAFWSSSTIPRAWMALTWLLGIAFVGSSHIGWHARISRGQRAGQLDLRTVIAGTNEEGRRLAQAMATRGSGFEPIGFLSTDRHVVEFAGLPVLGTLTGAVGAIRSTAADCLFVASSAVRAEDVAWLARSLSLEELEVRFSTNLPQLLISRLAVEPVAMIRSLSVRPARLATAQAAMKRATDVACSAALLIITAPLWGLILLTTRPSFRHVLARHERLGIRGRPFGQFAFHVSGGGKRGSFLRRHCLDRLPQLLNVLRGDMSLVGPRPPLLSEVSAYERWHIARLEVRPGMTGPGRTDAQTVGAFDETVRLDVFYVENWSFAYDLFLMVKTIPVLLRGREER